MRLQSTVTALLATALAATATVSPAIAPAQAAESSGAVVRPAKDPFYTYDGNKPLKDIKPGTPLKTRDVTLAADTNQTPLPAEQILYRTTDTLGKAVAASAVARRAVTVDWRRTGGPFSRRSCPPSNEGRAPELPAGHPSYPKSGSRCSCRKPRALS